MDGAADRLLTGGETLGRTDALLVMQGGDIVVERYGDGVDADSTRRSWSMAKSMLHAAVGILVAEGVLDLDAPAPVPQWREAADPRHRITLRDLLVMRPGLAWVEDPTEDEPSDVVGMLFGVDRAPVADTAAYAASKPLVADPGATSNYSSGTSSIVSAIVRDVVGPGAQYEAWLRHRLFDPLAMDSATPRFDRSGTWMASSYCFCTARDFGRFGQLYLRQGRGDPRVHATAERLLSPEWVRMAGTETGRLVDGRIHSAHWWIFGDNPWGAFHASGWRGQYLVVVPPLDLVVVRLGETATRLRPDVQAELTELIGSFDD